MPRNNLGSTLLIANPVSHSGKGALAANTVRQLFETYEAATSSFRMYLTEGQGDGMRFAAEAGDVDTVIALGGDGIIHEVVNGLMTLPVHTRPCLGVIPLGTGNDLARTLGFTLNNAEASISEMLRGEVRKMDVLHVVSDAHPEGAYVAETLSFGLDAAIAIDTIMRREKGTRQEGSGLFATSALKLVMRAHEGWPCTLRIDGGEPQDLTTLILAVQNGPTYGGGFKICPSACPNDGLFDICYNVRRPMLPHLLVLLGLARFGLHVGSSVAHIERGKSLEVTFSGGDAPCQVDGEVLEGTHFEAQVIPEALRVWAPPTCSW